MSPLRMGEHHTGEPYDASVATDAPPGAPVTLAAALEQAIASAKAGDALAPVTVVVASHHAAEGARRALALAGTGVANVSWATVPDLVEALALPELARRGLHLAPAPVEAEVLRSVAIAAGDPWASAVGHPRSLAALGRTHDELRRAGPEAIDTLARSPGRSGEVARLLVAARRRLHDHGLADAVDREESAQATALAGAASGRIGPVVLLDPGPLSAAEQDVLATIGRRSGSRRIELPGAATCTEVRPCAEPADEGRAAARAVLSALERGVPLWRQAVFHPPGTGYPRLLHAELDAAGIPWCGPAARTLERSAAGRSLLGLLDLAGGDLPRRAVLSWIGASPSAAPGDPVTRRWNAVSASAGVVRGLDQWRARLDRFALRQPSLGSEATELGSFVEDLGARLVPPQGSWAQAAHWARGLLDHFLAPDERWPDGERRARGDVRAAIDALAALDGVSPGPDLAAFAQALRGELGRRPMPAAAGGHGVLVAPFDLARGVRVDTVVLVGLVDGLVPGVDAEDARQALRAAVRAGETTRLATWPRLDPRTGRAQVASRLLAEVVDDRTAVRPVASFAGSLHLREPALGRAEEVQRALDALHRRGHDVAVSAPAQADPAVGRGIEVVQARGSKVFTRFDGRLEPGAVTPFDEEHPVSATRLETYAECPRRFLFERVLGVHDRNLPEDVWRIEARDRGSLVHAILERYVRARLGGAPRSLELLLGLADDCLDEAAADGMVGRALVWRLDRAAIARDLHLFFAEEGDAEPLAAEFAFGPEEDDDAPPVAVPLHGGQVVRFLGRADRVDRAADGGLVVSDYKTGRQVALARLTSDPLVGGRRLQLPLYALAARSHFGAAGPVRARYWMVSAERSTPCYHLELTEDMEFHFRVVVGRIARGIQAGAFPADPGPPRADGFEHCRYCDFDRACPATRDRQWAAKRADPALAPVTELLEAEVPPSVSGAVVRGPAEERSDA